MKNQMATLRQAAGERSANRATHPRGLRPTMLERGRFENRAPASSPAHASFCRLLGGFDRVADDRSLEGRGYGIGTGSGIGARG